MNDLYLAHHGIKGMRWGVRRYQNEDGSLTAAGHQRYLNSLDSKLKANTISLYNETYRQQHYMRKANKASNRGNIEKYQKNLDKANRAKNASSELYNQRRELGKKMADEIMSLNNSNEFSWRVSSTSFTRPDFKDARNQAQDIVNKYGKMGIGYNMLGGSNASSGNKFKVRNQQGMSDRKKARYEKHHALNSYRPQQVRYYST